MPYSAMSSTRFYTCAIVMIAFVGCDAQWSTFKSDHGFAISLPGGPEIRPAPLQIDGVGVEWFWHTARSSVDVDKRIPSATFMVGASTKLAAAQLEKVADEVRQIVISEGGKARVVTDEQLTQPGCRIRRVELRDDQLTTIAEIRSCADRIFALVVMGPDTAVRAHAVQFFTSFTTI